ncbi:hypothetical protein HK102_008726, partial [Quaeritorhiza haematococci]
GTGQEAELAADVNTREEVGETEPGEAARTVVKALKSWVGHDDLWRIIENKRSSAGRRKWLSEALVKHQLNQHLNQHGVDLSTRTGNLALEWAISILDVFGYKILLAIVFSGTDDENVDDKVHSHSAYEQLERLHQKEKGASFGRFGRALVSFPDEKLRLICSAFTPMESIPELIQQLRELYTSENWGPPASPDLVCQAEEHNRHPYPTDIREFLLTFKNGFDFETCHGLNQFLHLSDLEWFMSECHFSGSLTTFLATNGWVGINSIDYDMCWVAVEDTARRLGSGRLHRPLPFGQIGPSRLEDVSTSGSIFQVDVECHTYRLLSPSFHWSLSQYVHHMCTRIAHFIPLPSQDFKFTTEQVQQILMLREFHDHVFGILKDAGVDVVKEMGGHEADVALRTQKGIAWFDPVLDLNLRDAFANDPESEEDDMHMWGDEEDEEDEDESDDESYHEDGDSDDSDESDDSDSQDGEGENDGV